MTTATNATTAPARVTWERFPNPDLRDYCVTLPLTKPGADNHLDFTDGYRHNKTSQLSQGGADIVSSLLAIPGIVKVQISNKYTARVDLAKCFRWEDVQPAILAVLIAEVGKTCRPEGTASPEVMTEEIAYRYHGFNPNAHRSSYGYMSGMDEYMHMPMDFSHTPRGPHQEPEADTWSASYHNFKTVAVNRFGEFRQKTAAFVARSTPSFAGVTTLKERMQRALATATTAVSTSQAGQLLQRLLGRSSAAAPGAGEEGSRSTSPPAAASRPITDAVVNSGGTASGGGTKAEPVNPTRTDSDPANITAGTDSDPANGTAGTDSDPANGTAGTVSEPPKATAGTLDVNEILRGFGDTPVQPSTGS